MAIAQASTISDSNILLNGGRAASCQRIPKYNERLRIPQIIINLAKFEMIFFAKKAFAAYKTTAKK